ncbi:hypothetical protein K0U73_05320 [bacterium]|nr:hypothetical protein [bacterium]HAY68976.1 hypothetical protein [Acidimicrobiaceae bacterium]
MTPTLAGRMQSRLALLGTVGVVWTALIGLAVPRPEGAETSAIYKALFTALLIVAVAGIVWELVYHALQQYRWEKDWPTLFGLIVAVPEGTMVWILLKNQIPWDAGPVQASTFLTMFITLWLLIWAITNGPLQIVALRWRYRGGRFLGGWG